MTDHECLFPEEQEPSGRLILAPCLTCDLTALDALAALKGKLADAECGVEHAEALVEKVANAIYHSGEFDYPHIDNDLSMDESVHYARAALTAVDSRD